MSQKHLKPIFWGLFSAGGTTAAFALAPIILILCLLLPFGLLGDSHKFYINIHQLISHWFVYLMLTGIIFTFMWHGVHRLYYVLHDMHIHVGQRVRYGLYAFTLAAFVITLLSGWF